MDVSAPLRGFLLIGASYSGKTHCMVQFILAHPERRFVCFVKEIDNEWIKAANLSNVVLKVDCYGLLNRRSTLEKFKRRDVVVDDASLLNANERNRLFNFFNVRRKFGIRFWFVTHSFSKNLIEPLRLASFQVVCLLRGAKLDYPCLNVLLTGMPNMNKLTYPAYERIDSLKDRDVLVFDRDSDEFRLAGNDDTGLLTELQNRPMNSGVSKHEFLKSEAEQSGGKNNNNNSASKIALVRSLVQQGKTREEIRKEAKISPGYLRVILSDLRAEGVDVPKMKTGRPTALKTIEGRFFGLTEVTIDEQVSD